MKCGTTSCVLKATDRVTWPGEEPQPVDEIGCWLTGDYCPTCMERAIAMAKAAGVELRVEPLAE
jgi:hypothetical protein